MSTSNINRRQHSRFPIAVEYCLTIAGLEYTGVTGNLSLSGAYLATVDPELSASDVDAPGMLAFNTPAGVLSIDCRVVYVGSRIDDNPFPNGAGIMFNDPSQEVINAIWNLSIDHLMRG